MEQNKDQIGAVIAWMRPDEIDGLLEAAKSESATRQYGRVYAKQYDPDMVPVCGAAVRGEAVAMPAIRYEHKNKFHDGDYVEFVVGALYGYLIKQGVPKAAYYFSRDEAADYVAQGYWTEASVPIAPVSARAADVPSEPSEQELWDDNGEPMNDAAENEWRQSNERIRQRAADALDSQPTELPAECSDEMYHATTHICNLLEREDVNAMWRAMREVVLAISQPTEPTGDPAAYRVRLTVDGEMRTEVFAEFKAAFDFWMSNDGILDSLYPASSQPTDGGVRNG